MLQDPSHKRSRMSWISATPSVIEKTVPDWVQVYTIKYCKRWRVLSGPSQLGHKNDIYPP